MLFCLSRELCDLITMSDVLRQLKFVVLQLSHVMRVSHREMSAPQTNRWPGFEYCSSQASIVTQVRAVNTSEKRSFLRTGPSECVF